MDRDSFIIAVFLTVCSQYDFIKKNGVAAFRLP
jgi:hypothetical protein